MPVGLQKHTLDQGYFASGLIRAGRKTGPYDELNAYLDDAGDPNRRSGSTYRSNASFSANGLRWIWDGRLGGRQVTAFADSAHLGALDVDEATPVSFAATGTAAPVNAVVVHSLLFIEGAAYYGGSRKTSSYSAGGTLTATAGSASVAGVGTTFVGNVDPGTILNGYGVVLTVNSNTALTLTEPLFGPSLGGGANGLLAPYGSLSTVPVTPGFGGNASTSILGTVANRLVQAQDTRVGFSPIENPLSASGSDYHQIGATVTGLADLRDVLFVFTESGVFAISNMAYNLTDVAGNPQQRLEQVNRDLILWHRTGIANWRGTLIVPALDGVWLMDSISSPTKISQGITDLYRSYVNTAGYRPGGAAVYNNRYFLPIIDSSANVVDMLVCRPIDSRSGPPFAWTRYSGSGANVTALAVRAATSTAGPALLGAGRQASSRVLSLPYFDPTAATKQDHDATTHQYELDTGDVSVTDGKGRAFVKKVVATYELVDAASDNPTLDMSYQIDGESTWHLLSTTAPEDDGSNPFIWNVQHYAHRIRFRIRTQGIAQSMKLLRLEVFYRPTGKQ